MKNEKDNWMDPLPSPVKRALASKGVKTVMQLSSFTEKELLALHGVGRSGIIIMKNILAENGLSLKNE